MMHFSLAHPAGCECRIPHRHGVFIGLLLVLLTFLPKPGFAASSCRSNGNLTVTVSTAGISFGSYDVLSTGSTPGTGTITVSATCTHTSLPFTVSYTLALSTGSSSSFSPRTMVSGASILQYNLYTTASLTTIWGDGTGGTKTVADTLTGTCARAGGRNCSGSQPTSVYANIPATQNVAAGNYADSLTVSINF